MRRACEPNEILISYETYAHVKDQVLCEEKEKILVKGISHPISTYLVVDFYENLREDRPIIRARQPHFQLEADVAHMTDDEKLSASEVVRKLSEKLR